MKNFHRTSLLLIAAFVANVQADPAQTGQWTQIFGEPYSGYMYSDSDYAQDIAYDGSGNLYLTGCYNSSSAAGRDYCNFFVGKMDTNGGQAWINEEPTAWNNHNFGKQVEVDSQGDIIVSGLNNASTSLNRESFIAKYDSNGNQIWITYFGLGEGIATQFVLDENDNIYVAGYSSANDPDPTDSVYYQDAVLYHFDTNGNQLWKQLYASPTSDDALVAYDKAGSKLYTIVNTVDSPTGQRTISMRHMHNDGTLWLQKDYTGTSPYLKAEVVTHVQGSLVLAGNAPTTLFTPDEISYTNRPYFVVKLSTSLGAFGSVRSLDRYTTCDGCMEFTGIHIDQYSRTHLTGKYGKNSSGNITGGKNLTTWGNDVFYSLYNSAGERIKIDQMGATGRDWPGGVTTDEDGNAFISGGVYGDLNGVTAPGANGSSSEIFVTRNEP